VDTPLELVQARRRPLVCPPDPEAVDRLCRFSRIVVLCRDGKQLPLVEPRGYGDPAAFDALLCAAGLVDYVRPSRAGESSGYVRVTEVRPGLRYREVFDIVDPEDN
jgi:hypothetical protein